MLGRHDGTNATFLTGEHVLASEYEPASATTRSIPTLSTARIGSQLRPSPDHYGKNNMGLHITDHAELGERYKRSFCRDAQPFSYVE